MTEKICGRCRQLLPSSAFSVRQAWCRKCFSEYGAERKQQMREGAWAPLGPASYACAADRKAAEAVHVVQCRLRRAEKRVEAWAQKVAALRAEVEARKAALPVKERRPR